MRELTLALAITAASLMQAQAQTMPITVPTTYPAEGMFCGFMQVCTPKATAPRPKGVTAQVQRPSQ